MPIAVASGDLSRVRFLPAPFYKFAMPVEDPLDRQPNDPTEDEIAERCAEIRATWTEAERRRRIVGPAEEMTVEVVSVRELAA
ncbi:hypothetical protein [Botrimarina colliarenosi]|uniref:hypothetical protein n=1 Tax=Botrimarina colliarenosi TaxID=2528001 RepID=UPI0011B65D34|nr:hypothetical protein [Botrimarina colliarenosi]